MQLVLAKDFVIGFIGERCIIGSGARQTSLLETQKYMPLLRVAEMWISPHSKEDVIQSVVLMGYDLNEVKCAVDYLLSQNHVCKWAEEDAGDRMSAALAASDVLRFLGKVVAPHSLNRRIGLHSASLKLEFQHCPRSKQCEICAVF